MATDITLPSEDSKRIATLTKEIQSRLDDMLTIAARAMGVPREGLQAKFVPEKTTANFSGMHIEILDDIKGETCCVVWEHWPDPPAKLVCPC